MVGIEDGAAARLGRLAREIFVAGADGGLAEARDRAWRLRRAVAVDQQPRIALRDQMRAEMSGQRLRDAGDADVPGDVTRQLAFRQAEIAEPARDRLAIMIRCQQERRAPGGVMFA